MKTIVAILMVIGLIVGVSNTGHCRSSTVTMGHKRVIYNPPKPKPKPTTDTNSSSQNQGTDQNKR